MKNKKGFSLVEVLISTLIMGITLGSLLLLFVRCSKSVEVSKNTNIALSHVKAVIEEMRAYNNDSDVVNEDWTVWAENNGCDSLKEESINVDIDSSVTPLEITVTANWKNRQDGDRSITLATLFMQR